MGTIEGHDDITTRGDNPSSLITFKGVHDITIDGSGTIDGRGSLWWDCEKAGKDVRTLSIVLYTRHSNFFYLYSH